MLDNAFKKNVTAFDLIHGSNVPMFLDDKWTGPLMHVLMT